MSELSFYSAKSTKAPKSDVSEMSVDSAKSTKAPKSVVSKLSVYSAKSTKAPKSVVSELFVESAKSIKARKSVVSQRGGGSVDSERYSVVFSENPIAIPYQKLNCNHQKIKAYQDCLDTFVLIFSTH